MSRYASAELRRKVARRANFRCEYCRLPEFAAMTRFQLEHIVSLKHGGKTTLENLAYACPICNSGKGTDLGTIIEAMIHLFDFLIRAKTTGLSILK